MMSFEEVFESSEYKISKNQVIEKIIRHSLNAPNEATVASHFELNLYSLIKDNFDQDIEFIREPTANDGFINTFKGRMDAVSSNLIIEYKRPDKLKRDSDILSAINQLRGYMTQLKTEGQTFEGFLTDGGHYIKAYFVGDTLVTEKMRPLDSSGIDFLVSELLNLDKKQLVSRNLQQDFGKGSILTKIQRQLFQQILGATDEKTQMLYEEWLDIFHLSLNDDGKSSTISERKNELSGAVDAVLQSTDDEYKALFAMQTGYAIVVKVFALKILSKIGLSREVTHFSDLLTQTPNQLQKIFELIEDGYIFQTSKVYNLLEGDFYSWYVSDNQWTTDIANSLRDLIQVVESYADASLSFKFESTDLFKDLYMLAIPQKVRKAFGEVFTPDWLADNVVQSSIQKVATEKPNWTFLDPTAGSGTFVIKAISNIVKEMLQKGSSKSEILTQVLTRVKGIDLNPLSVLAGRVSYLLSIKPFLDGRDIEIPFYLGDSARLPDSFNEDGIEYISYSIDTQKATIDIFFPLDFVKSVDFLPKVYKWQTYINIEDSQLLFETIRNEFPQNISHNLEDKIKQLSNVLVKLKKKNWDGIWLKIISNFVLSTRISDIDIIAGNPPWVKWENLPKLYANRIKDIAGERKLFSGKNKGLGGGINLNLAALISNVTASNWLSEQGVLAFLMPDTLLNSDSYEGWRNLEGNGGAKLYLEEVHDWTNSGNPFEPVQEKFLTYYIRKCRVNNPTLIKFNKAFNRGINILDINRNKNWNDVKNSFIEEHGVIIQLSRQSNRYSRVFGATHEDIEKFLLLDGVNEYKARQGVELTPREVFVFEKNDDGTYSNVRVRLAKIKPTHYDSLVLEEGIVKPLLQSSNIRPFDILEEFQWGMIPYDDEQQIYTPRELALSYPNSLNYLSNQKRFIESQSERSKLMARGKEFYALSKIGKYSKFDYAVVFRDNTKMIASFIDNSNRKQQLFPVKHAPFISRDVKGNPLSKSEALYLTGILNTPIIQKYFKYTYSDRSFSINFDISIPKYDEHNYFQKNIVYQVQLIRKIKKLRGVVPKVLLNNVETLYIKLLKSKRL